MTQVLTIDFQYKRQTYTALASMIKRDNDYSVSIQFFNDELKHVVPEGELFFHLHHGLQRASQPSEKQQLIKAIREAIISHDHLGIES